MVTRQGRMKGETSLLAQLLGQAASDVCLCCQCLGLGRQASCPLEVLQQKAPEIHAVCEPKPCAMFCLLSALAPFASKHS